MKWELNKIIDFYFNEKCNLFTQVSKWQDQQLMLTCEIRPLLHTDFFKWTLVHVTPMVFRACNIP